MKIDVISDVMCPWCYIGKRRIEAAVERRPDITVEIIWHPFKLDPTIPRGGVDRKEYLERKFGGPEGAAEIYARINEAGQSEGISFAFDRIVRSPNTTDAHRLIRWARESGGQDQVVESLFQAYFCDGQDIENADVLSGIADDAGMDADRIRQRLATDEALAEVDEDIAFAQKIGVTGVPTFLLAQKLAVVGAQGPDILVQAMDQAAETVAAH